MTLAQLLLDLQSIDTSADQLTHRREHSALRAEFAAATERAKEWERRRTTLRSRIDELGAVIDAAEKKGAELSTHRLRLEQQLKTVIAPREAEALMHEMATVESQRDELDTQELVALEEQASVDDQLAAHLAEQDAVTTAVRLADTAFAEEVADIEAELAALAQRRDDVRGGDRRRPPGHVRPQAGRVRRCGRVTRRQAVPGLPPGAVGRRDRHRQGRGCGDGRRRLPRLRSAVDRLSRVLLVHRHRGDLGRPRLP